MQNFTKTIAAGLALTFASTAVQADMNYSDLIRDRGLAGAEAHLLRIENHTDSDLFALGGLHFLGAVEQALQSLYATQIDRDMIEMSGLPFLRLPLPENPNAKPFQAEQIRHVFLNAMADLEQSLVMLDAIDVSGDVGVVIDTGDLWLDVNANGLRDMGEGFYAIAAPQLARQLGNATEQEFIPPVIRFDGSDVAWLAAYAHLLSGISETVLSVDTTGAISRVVGSRARMSDFMGGQYPRYIGPDEFKLIDVVTMWLHALEGQPDVTRTRAALDHFRDMIAENKTFWARVVAETDNDREWIPNVGQQTALPIEFPPETGASWQAVLAEAEQILDGTLLFPHPLISGSTNWQGEWQGANVGINLAAFLTNPPDVNLISMIHGEGFLPYLENGPVASGRSLWEFERLMRGDAGLFMVILN